MEQKRGQLTNKAKQLKLLPKYVDFFQTFVHIIRTIYKFLLSIAGYALDL